MLMVSLTVIDCTAQAARDPAPAPAASAPSSASSNTNLASLNNSGWRFVELGGVSTPTGIEMLDAAGKPLAKLQQLTP